MKRGATIAAGLIAGVLVAAMAGGCGKGKAKKEQPETSQAGVPVAIAPVVLGATSRTVPVTGSLKALRSAEVRPQLVVRVTEVRVREGDAVTQGQVLLVLDRIDASAQLRQAAAALGSSQAAAGAARAQWQAAQRRLEVLQQGARPEERSIARNRVAQAEAAFRKADADLARRKTLFAQGAISREDLDAAQTAYEAARADLDTARSSLQLTEKGPRPEELAAATEEAAAAGKQTESAQANVEQAAAALARAQEVSSYTVITAPISGVIYERHVEPGELARMGDDPLFRIADLNSVYFEAAVPGRLAEEVRVGQVAEVAVRGDGAQQVKGSVLALVPVASPSSRDFVARIGVPKLPKLSRPGSYAEGQIVVAEHRGVPVIPKDALVERSGRRVVFVVTAGKARERPVQVGLTEVSRVEVTAGLRPGEQVVVEGAQSLNDGAAVTIQKAGGR